MLFHYHVNVVFCAQACTSISSFCPSDTFVCRHLTKTITRIPKILRSLGSSIGKLGWKAIQNDFVQHHRLACITSKNLVADRACADLMTLTGRGCGQAPWSAAHLKLEMWETMKSTCFAERQMARVKKLLDRHLLLTTRLTHPVRGTSTTRAMDRPSMPISAAAAHGFKPK